MAKPIVFDVIRRAAWNVAAGLYDDDVIAK
jgi:hypothetical protein